MLCTSLIKVDGMKYNVAAYVQSEPVDTTLLCQYICMNATGKEAHACSASAMI